MGKRTYYPDYSHWVLEIQVGAGPHTYDLYWSTRAAMSRRVSQANKRPNTIATVHPVLFHGGGALTSDGRPYITIPPDKVLMAHQFTDKTRRS